MQDINGVYHFAGHLRNAKDAARVLAALGQEPDYAELVTAESENILALFERVFHHHAFTGRSGTMFGYEGLGCIYWHMVAKLLLAVQERVFEAADQGAPELPVLRAFYRRVRDGLGYRRGVAAYGAFPADPYSHTPGEGGAQQPGMTGQVKEEILARWGELGVRVAGGRIRFQPVLLHPRELPGDGVLTFSFGRVPWRVRRGPALRLRVHDGSGWRDCPDGFEPAGVVAVEAEAPV